MPYKRVILSLSLMLSLATLSAWGADEAATEEETNTSVQPSNIEGWEEEERDEGTWTWFGMGYESREAASSQPGKTNPGSGGSPGASGGGKR